MGAMETWLTLRSARTLALRVLRQSKTGIAPFVRNFHRMATELKSISAAHNPALLRPLETRAFVELGAVISDERHQATVQYGGLLRTLRVVDQQRLLCFHNGTLMGWVGYVRHDGEPRFSRADRKRVSRLVPRVTALVTAAARLDEEHSPAAPGDFVVRPDGSLELASERGRAWLAAPGFADAMKRRIREMDRGLGEETALPPLADARIVRVDGGGLVRYVVNVERCRLLTAPPATRLSPAQQRVAELAAAGATAPEIAGLLNVAPSTIRTHLKHIFRIIHVSSRAELATYLAPRIPGSHPQGE